MQGRLWVFGLLLVAAAAWALDPPKPAPAAGQPETAAAAQPPAAAPAPAEVPATGVEDDAEELPPLPAGTRPTGPTPQRFDPTEKIRADFPVSFPIDI